MALLWAGFRGPVEQAFADGPVAWTGLEPVSFLGNTLVWRDRIRDQGAVAEPFVDVAETMVDERDVGEVAAAVLLDDGPRGPPVLAHRPSSRHRARPGRRAVRAPRPPARPGGAQRGRGPTPVGATRGTTTASIDALVAWQQRPVDEATRVDPAVPDLLGRPAYTFDDWLDRHADDFR